MHYITPTTHLHLVPVNDYNVMYQHDYDVKSHLQTAGFITIHCLRETGY